MEGKVGRVFRNNYKGQYQGGAWGQAEGDGDGWGGGERETTVLDQQ